MEGLLSEGKNNHSIVACTESKDRIERLHDLIAKRSGRGEGSGLPARIATPPGHRPIRNYEKTLVFETFDTKQRFM